MATMQDLLTYEDMLGALKLEANEMASCYIENTGNGEFELVHLPTLAQIAPVNGLITKDVNDDGNADVIMVGNDYGNEVFAGRYDAFTGLILLGNGHGGFSAKGSAETGFYVPGDAKSLVSLIGTKNDLLIASQNRDSLKVFARATTENVNRFIPEALDVKADLMLEDGRKQLVEFHYGAGYLSQSARELILPKGVTDILVYDSQGHSRKEIRKPL
jgi:hypothetical protein